MGNFFDFLVIFQYNFDDSWDIHGMRPIFLGYFFLTIMLRISTFHFRTSMIQGEQFFKMFDHFLLWDLWKGTGDYWYNHGMWPIIVVYFQQARIQDGWHPGQRNKMRPPPNSDCAPPPGQIWWHFRGDVRHLGFLCLTWPSALCTRHQQQQKKGEGWY